MEKIYILNSSIEIFAIYLRASGSGRRPQRRMARLQISGHYAYPAVRSDLTPAPVAPARCIECHADSLSYPLTQLYIPGVPGGVQRGSRDYRGFANSRKTRKIRQTFRSCLSSLARSCIQDCVQEVPVGQLAQRTPPSAHAAAFQGGFNRLHQLLHGFFTKSQVKSSQNHLPT